MCWFGNLKAKKIAKKCITVYKILSKDTHGNYVAPYMEMVYEIGEMYTISSLTPKRDFLFLDEYSIDEGFHSFDEHCVVTHMSSINTFVRDIHGLSVFEIPTREGCTAVIAKCTIPKGAEYWENWRGEIVSNTLIVDKIYDVPYERTPFNELDK